MKKGPSVNKLREKANKDRVLGTVTRMEHLKAYITEEENNDRTKEDRRVDKSRRRRDEYGVSLKCFQLGNIDWNPDSKENAHKNLTVANFKEFVVHRDIQLVKAVKT